MKRLLRRIVRLGLRSERVRGLVGSELARATRVAGAKRPADSPPPTTSIAVADGRRFADRYGTVHIVDPELRDRLKPAWRTMVDPDQAAAAPTDAALRDRAKKAVATVAEANAIVAALTGRALTGRILEIGCYDGSTAFAMAADPAIDVVGSDLARYYVVQRPGEPPTAAAVEAQQATLAELRERARVVAGIQPSRVTFIEDDITRSRLEEDSFDAIVSFEVLEHLLDPPAAFSAMATLLKPGGIVYHDYNPFFAMNGGHSLVTLDIPWGHARLDDADVERYLRELRPTEADQALRFYRDSLNRMSRADLVSALDGAGLETLAIIPWTQRALAPQLTHDVVNDVERTYPGVRAEELLQTFVTVVARKSG